jgi:hypothetical protein
MYDWSSFSKDKEFTDAWREFLTEKKITEAPSDRPRTSPGRSPRPKPDEPEADSETDFYREKKKELEARKKAGKDAAAADRKAAGESTLSDKLAGALASGREITAAETKKIHQKLDKAAIALNQSLQMTRAAESEAEERVRALGWKGIPEAATAFDIDPDNPEDVTKKCGFSFGWESVCKGWGREQKAPEEEDTSAAAAGAAPEDSEGPTPITGNPVVRPGNLDEIELRQFLDKSWGRMKDVGAAIRAQTEKGHSEGQDAKLALARQACQAVCIYFKGMATTKSGRDFFTRSLGITPSQAGTGKQMWAAMKAKAQQDARAMGPVEEPTEETPEEEEEAPDRGAVIREVRASDTWEKVLAAFEALVQKKDKSSARRIVEKFYSEDSSEEEKEDFARFYALVKGTPDGGEADLSRDVLRLMPSDVLEDELNLKHSDEVQGSAQEFKQSLGRIFQWGKEQFPREEGFEGVELKAMSENVNLKLKNLIKEELLRVKNEER